MDESDDDVALIEGLGDSRVPVSLEAKTLFLSTLAKSGSQAQAAKAACPQMKQASAMAYFRKLRAQDPAFREAFQEALLQTQTTLEDVAYDHAVNGTEKPVFYMGFECGTIVEHDHKLLITVIKRNARLLGDTSWEEPKGGDTTNIQNNVTQNLTVKFRNLPKAERDAILAQRKALADKGVIDVEKKP